MLEVEYNGERRRYMFSTVRKAVRDFRREFGLVGKHLHGELVVWRLGERGGDCKILKTV